MSNRRRAVRVKSTGPGLGARAVGLLALAWTPFLVWVLPAAVLAGLCLGGLYLCRAHVASSEQYQITAPVIHIPNKPLWWEQEFQDQIDRACAFANGASTFDDELLEKVAAAYLQCPWVNRVYWVKKHFPNQIRASIDIRWPAAAVAFGPANSRRYYLVGRDGIRLPKAYATWPQAGLNVPFIVGTRSAPPLPGEPWGEGAVTAAIEIVERLKASGVIRKSINITAVSVGNYLGRLSRDKSEFVVYAENNCVIEWGRAPSTNRPGELPVKEKIAKLERFLSEQNPTNNRTLDVRFKGRVVVSRRYGTNGDSS